MLRYLRLLAVQLKASFMVSMQYRVDFLVQGGISGFWAIMTLAPLLVVFNAERPSIAGWSFAEILVVVGWFTLLKALLDGAVQPSLLAVVEHIRKGTLDFVLMKPADAQFLVSTTKFELWKIIDVLLSFGIFGYAFHLLGRWPRPEHVIAGLGMLLIATLTIYSLWILVIAAAFYVVKMDNLTYLLGSVYEAARWPVGIFKGSLRFIFTYVIPLALMTTYPAMALLGTLELSTAFYSLLGALAFAAASRAVWLGSLGKYTSASS